MLWFLVFGWIYVRNIQNYLEADLIEQLLKPIWYICVFLKPWADRRDRYICILNVSKLELNSDKNDHLTRLILSFRLYAYNRAYLWWVQFRVWCFSHKDVTPNVQQQLRKLFGAPIIFIHMIVNYLQLTFNKQLEKYL